MYTSVLVFALAGFLVSAARESPSWQTDYQIALKLGRNSSKPLAVFVGSGKAGWNSVSQEGNFGRDINKILSDGYVCVYIDTDRDEGKRLASAFEVETDNALIISDHTGRLQAFHHQGNLANEDLAKCLNRFADPERVVRATEDLDWHSYYYPAEFSPSRQNYVPVPVMYPPFGGGSGRSC